MSDAREYIVKNFERAVAEIDNGGEFQRGVEFAIKFLQQHTDEIHREYLLSSKHDDQKLIIRQAMAFSGDILDVALAAIMSTFPSRDPAEGECAY